MRMGKMTDKYSSRVVKSYGTPMDDYDDYFSDVEIRRAVEALSASPTEPKMEKTSVEKDYIDICFIDLKDTNSIETTIARNDNIDAAIKINSIKKSNTFSSYKTYYDEVYNKMNIIEDSIMKVKLKYPHCNVTIKIEDNYISLSFIL
jgi:hypothetical protein